MLFYKLDENKKVMPSSLEEWSELIDGRLPTNYRHVADDMIEGKRVSTVFHGLCHNYNLSIEIPSVFKPLVFETMIFDNKQAENYQERYSTWEEAEEGHKRAIEWVKGGCKEDEL